MLTPEYNETLKRLATTLYEPFKSPQESLDFDVELDPAEPAATPAIGKTALNRWDDMGGYLGDNDE